MSSNEPEEMQNEAVEPEVGADSAAPAPGKKEEKKKKQAPKIPELPKEKKKDEEQKENPMVKLANNLLEGLKPMGEGVSNGISNIGSKLKKVFSEDKAPGEQNQETDSQALSGQEKADTADSLSEQRARVISTTGPDSSPDPSKPPPLPTTEPPSFSPDADPSKPPPLPTTEPPSSSPDADSSKPPPLPTTEPPSLEGDEIEAPTPLEDAGTDEKPSDDAELAVPPDSNSAGNDYSEVMQASKVTGYGAQADESAKKQESTPAPEETASSGMSMG